MSKEYQIVVGIDVSKKTIDVALLRMDNAKHISFKTSNSEAGVKKLMQFLSANQAAPEQVLFCLEQTGMYSYSLVCNLYKYCKNIWVEMPYKISRSSGLQRGKSDAVDAIQIARYALRHQDKVVLWSPDDEEMIELRDLIELREKLTSSLLAMRVPINEMKKMGLSQKAKNYSVACKKPMKALEKSIAELEVKIDALLLRNTKIQKQVELLSSVPGVGKITALYFIAYTQGFTLFESSKKLACYCGIAPFPHESGTSVRGRARVHHMANKKLKLMLHLSAMRIARMKNSIRDYYDAKVTQGKSRMSALNAVRNKLLSKMFAVIKSGKMYQENYEHNRLVFS
jgi:transposase